MTSDCGVDGGWAAAAVGAEPPGSSVWAAGVAARLLSDLPKKWAHTQEVARHARWAAAGIDPADRDSLVATAYLHDIGYAADIAHTGFHPLDGARYLRGLGLFDLACLVGHHSGAAVEAHYRGLTSELAEFPRPVGPVADAVTYADVTSGPVGQAMQPGDRFAEIIDRHGPDSVVAAARTDARAQMYAAVARTLRRATAARPLLTALAVTPVELGCSTLLRFHGALTYATADHAARALHEVLNGGSHAVVCDLSQLTTLDNVAARRLARIVSTATSVLTAPTSERGQVAITLVDVPPARRRTLVNAFPEPGTAPLATNIELVPHCT